MTKAPSEVDIFGELRKLDDRVQQVSQLLEASGKLFAEHYSEQFRDTKGSFSWPYAIGPIPPPHWPDYPDFPDTRKLSPLTNAICGWSVGNYLQTVAKGQLSEIAALMADKLANLPPRRLKSSTFQSEDEIFLHAQVLRFLAWRAKWDGEMFETVFDRVHTVASNPDPNLHPFFLHYCILALEEVRIPATNIAGTALEICAVAETAHRTKASPNSLANVLSLFDTAAKLQNALEKLTTLVEINFRMPAVSNELKELTSRSIEYVDEITSAISNKGKKGKTKLPSLDPVIESCIKQASAALDALPKKVVSITPAEQRSGWPTTSEQVLHSVATRLKDNFVWYDEALRKRLRSEILSQISYAASADTSRLDIGALTYSLAGALRIDAINITNPLARKALSLIFEHQTHGRWRDVQPMSRTKQGFVHVPLNLEIANALLAILAKDPDVSVDLSLTQLDEVMDWIAGTVNTVNQYQGWSNEQDYSAERIDFWVTAQVVQFLAVYRETRIRLTTRWALEQAGLATIYPNSVPTRWEDLTPTDLERPYSQQVKNKIKDKLAVPFERTKALASSSVLLYGPPGTSKTSLMEGLANRLQWQFLQVSPADFLSAGGDQVEARATLIFEIIKRAQNLVVLFDEVDEFLIDREAPERLEGIFRFMTTSMLPKLQSLRTRRSVIFGIATNYKERLDKAITRLGRVDYDWAVLPPDFTARILLVNQFNPNVSESDARQLAADTPFFSFLELRRVVRERLTFAQDPWLIIRHPTASPEAYANRPDSDDEFDVLLHSQLSKPVLIAASESTRDRVHEQLDRLHVKSGGADPLFNEDLDAKVVQMMKELESVPTVKTRKP